MPKLIYLPMNLETINCLDYNRLEVLSHHANIPEIFWKKNNVNFYTSTILSKSSNWNAWLGPECSSAGGFNTLFKIKT